MTIAIDKGDPTPEELAALVVALLSVRSSTSEPAPVSAWWRSGLPVHKPWWTQSGLPRMSHR
jgi:Acyl-CoA carboxylase epsilon subunit